MPESTIPTTPPPPGQQYVLAPVAQTPDLPGTLVSLLPPKYAVWGVLGLGLFRLFFPSAFAAIPGAAPVAQSAPAPINRASDIKPWNGPIAPPEPVYPNPNPPKDKPAPPH